MLTRKQYELLVFVHDRLQKTGVPPSFDEMKDALDLRSKSGIHRLIMALEERGFIRRLAGRSDLGPDTESAVLGCDLPANDERTDYMRAELSARPDGTLVAAPYRVQDSSMLAPLAQAGCLVIREPYAAAAKAGTRCRIVKLTF